MSDAPKDLTTEDVMRLLAQRARPPKRGSEEGLFVPGGWPPINPGRDPEGQVRGERGSESNVIAPGSPMLSARDYPKPIPGLPTISGISTSDLREHPWRHAFQSLRQGPMSIGYQPLSEALAIATAANIGRHALFWPFMRGHAGARIPPGTTKPSGGGDMGPDLTNPAAYRMGRAAEGETPTPQIELSPIPEEHLPPKKDGGGPVQRPPNELTDVEQARYLHNRADQGESDALRLGTAGLLEHLHGLIGAMAMPSYAKIPAGMFAGKGLYDVYRAKQAADDSIARRKEAETFDQAVAGPQTSKPPQAQPQTVVPKTPPRPSWTGESDSGKPFKEQSAEHEIEAQRNAQAAKVEALLGGLALAGGALWPEPIGKTIALVGGGMSLGSAGLQALAAGGRRYRASDYNRAGDLQEGHYQGQPDSYMQEAMDAKASPGRAEGGPNPPEDPQALLEQAYGSRITEPGKVLTSPPIGTRHDVFPRDPGLPAAPPAAEYKHNWGSAGPQFGEELAAHAGQAIDRGDYGELLRRAPELVPLFGVGAIRGRGRGQGPREPLDTRPPKSPAFRDEAMATELEKKPGAPAIFSPNAADPGFARTIARTDTKQQFNNPFFEVRPRPPNVSLPRNENEKSALQKLAETDPAAKNALDFMNQVEHRLKDPDAPRPIPPSERPPPPRTYEDAAREQAAERRARTIRGTVDELQGIRAGDVPDFLKTPDGSAPTRRSVLKAAQPLLSEMRNEYGFTVMRSGLPDDPQQLANIMTTLHRAMVPLGRAPRGGPHFGIYIGEPGSGLRRGNDGYSDNTGLNIPIDVNSRQLTQFLWELRNPGVPPPPPPLRVVKEEGGSVTDLLREHYGDHQ